MGCGDENRRASGQDNRLTGRRLTTEADIRDAIDWRLAGVGKREIGALASLLRPLADDFREDRPEVAAVLRDLRPRGRRGAWSLACAILARDAWQRNNLFLAWSAGFEVVMARRNAGRGGMPRNFDQLSGLIVEHLAHQPEITGPALFAHFGELAGPGREVLVDFDGELLAFVPKPGWACKEISEHVFCARVSRLKNHVSALA